MKKLLIRILQRLLNRLFLDYIDEQKKINLRLEKIHIDLGKLQSKANIQKSSLNLSENGFSVFSQWDEDGIIQFIIYKIPEIPRIFIEFGVENYTESNTRFLLLKDHWKGLIIDGSEEYINSIKKTELYWKTKLIAEYAFIDADNIETIFAKNKFSGDIGILSVDIDGNDYWILKKITSVRPVVVIVEFNNLLGIKKSLSVPYDPKFIRHDKHYSGLYFGASLKAFYDLLKIRGYSFIGCNEINNNAFFVLNEFAGRFQVLTLEEGYSYNWVRESRNSIGDLTFLDNRLERLEEIKDLNFLDLESNQLIKIKDYIDYI
ncbi:hypothetical protein EHQ43_14275 [Leptospira bouyouniensis]|uniref:Uncharacterized protein n=1 Tax=Leptospira bouyouniensis TaxID=2484911 RepID=A0A7I0HRD6_9LEPT|nr:FkbM family methyltransferase [Leptospira bouyouniensis]TGL04531.1 hypothetical protein EHQ43_14275 [Leptospira bouyouniensis]